MQTDTVCAFQVENNDFIVIDGEVVGYVYSIIDDRGDYIGFDMVDDDGEHTMYAFAPFDVVTIVTSFDTEELADALGIDMDAVGD